MPIGPARLIHPSGEDLAIVGPVKSRQSEAGHGDRSGCDPGILERRANRGIERLAGGLQTDGLGIRWPRDAAAQDPPSRFGKPDLRGRTSAICAEQSYRSRGC